MRCKNCGWPNKPNERVCVKCHAPLSADDDSIEREVGGSEGDASLSKTVCEEDVFGQSMNEPYPSGNNQAETSEEKTKPVSEVWLSCTYRNREMSELQVPCFTRWRNQSATAYCNGRQPEIGGISFSSYQNESRRKQNHRIPWNHQSIYDEYGDGTYICIETYQTDE